MADKDIAVSEHLYELRKRLIIILSVLTVATIISYYNVPAVVNFLVKPLGNLKLQLVFFDMTEGFVVRIKIALFTALIAVSPVIFYHFVLFINPGLEKKEKKLLYRSVVFISALFFAGIVFGYLMVLPYTLNFLISYGQNYMKPVLSGDMYFSFIGMFCLVTGITFVIPLALTFFGYIGLVHSKLLRKWRKIVFISTIVVETMVLPMADIFTYILTAAPILILFEASIWIVYFMERKKKKTERLTQLS